MAVTAAQTRKETWTRGCRAGEKCGRHGRSENRTGAPCFERVWSCLLGWHHNFVWSHHVEPAAGSRFNYSRVVPQLVYLEPQRLVAAAQAFHVSANSRVLLTGQIHLCSRPHQDGHAHCERGQKDHSKDHPGRYDSAPSPNFGPSSD